MVPNPDVEVLVATEADLRTRVINLMFSSAAQRINFVIDDIAFSSGYFSAVASGMMIRSLPESNGIVWGVGFRLGKLPAGVEAAYDVNDNVIVVPSFDFGKGEFEQSVLIRECVLAWRDGMGPQV